MSCTTVIVRMKRSSELHLSSAIAIGAPINANGEKRMSRHSGMSHYA